MATWAQALRDAQQFIEEQVPDIDRRTATYIAKTVLRMGEQIAPWREQRDYDRDSRRGGSW